MRSTNPKLSPFTGDSSRARPVDDAARGESGGIGSIASGSAARRPYSNQRSWHGAAVTKGERLKLPCYLTVPPSDNPPKLSPGWNKVALLTAVRNSPCSCPFSVSLHPLLAALNSEPRKRWRLLLPQSRLTPCQLPHRGSLLVDAQTLTLSLPVEGGGCE